MEGSLKEQKTRDDKNLDPGPQASISCLWMGMEDFLPLGALGWAWKIPSHSPNCCPRWVGGHWRGAAHILHTSEPIRATGQKHARAMQDEALGAAGLWEEWAQMPGLWGRRG